MTLRIALGRPRSAPERTASLALALAAVTAVSGGCVAALAAGAAAATVGYVQYRENEASQDFAVPLEPVWDAALDALQKLNYAVSDSAPLGPTEGEVQIDDVWLRAEAHPADGESAAFTRVRVRVGTFDTGDNERRARLILAEVASQLEET